MNVTLSPELERKVLERIGDPYETASEVVEEALKSFFGPDRLSVAEIEELNKSIDAGLSDAASGHTVDGKEALEDIITRLKARRTS
jgi:predicted transcriptional regulator